MSFDSTNLDLIEQLERQNIALSLNIDQDPNKLLSKRQVFRLLNLASSLSLSNDTDDLILAHDICSRIIECFAKKHQSIVAGADLILSRLGNFPGRSLLRSKYSSGNVATSFSLLFETIARESDNSLDDGNLLTDFQYDLFTSLQSENSLSVSAPTSAGKSHVLSLDLIQRIKSNKDSCLAYIVPTRALVAEVLLRVRTALRNEGLVDVAVRSAPFPVAPNNKTRCTVFVLTQERFLRLLSFPANEVQITAIIVDEAHEIQKGKRGILLQNAVDIALKKYPNCSLYFASPLIKNPAYLLNLFNRNKNGKYFTEERSPVSQNIILVSDVARKPKLVEINLLTRGVKTLIGTTKLSFPFRGSKAEQKSLFMLEICRQNESCIVFADDAAEAETCAVTAAKSAGDFSISEDVADFISFIRAEIHAEYPLIETLKKGIGFHYGNMPSIVRTGVERMFKQGHIRFLCCTSTLLQGVNLPAKHIIIQNPHLGKDNMSRADFRNLAGRAGRLLQEFHGNVWCLRPGEWENDCYQGENLQEIAAAMDLVMQDGGSLVGAVIEGIDKKEDSDIADAAFSRLYHEIKDNGSEKVIERYGTNENREILYENIYQLKSLKIDLPSNFLEVHRSLRPDLLQNLFDILQNQRILENLILVNPHERGGKERMTTAVSLINEAFGIVMPDRYFNLITGVSHKWVWGTPVGEMLGERVSYIREKNPNEAASPIIRSLLQVIEKEVRYKLVKYFAAYEDLLRLAWKTQNKSKEISVAPYHVYLEFGASEPTTLSLMALGLSRFTAIKLKKIFNWPDERDPEECLKRLSHLKVDELYLPRICKLELRDLLG